MKTLLKLKIPFLRFWRWILMQDLISFERDKRELEGLTIRTQAQGYEIKAKIKQLTLDIGNLENSVFNINKEIQHLRNI